MILGQVIGSLWASQQDPGFDGLSLKMVIPQDARSQAVSGNTIVAVDLVGSRQGDTVMIVYEGGSSRLCMGRETSPAEAIIVGIVDEINLMEASGG